MTRVICTKKMSVQSEEPDQTMIVEDEENRQDENEPAPILDRFFVIHFADHPTGMELDTDQGED